ncbi:MAG: N-acetyltransferase [Cyanobacteriota bacterium]|nr:N-acetyltransferase [Cyanobacteriota bacterium]
MSLPSLLIPFRPQPPAPRLPEGYRLLDNAPLPAAALNRLLCQSDEKPRDPAIWDAVLERSTWHFGVLRDADASLVGFVRITSDMALNANLWDLCADTADPARNAIYAALVGAALGRLRRELSGCSISLAAPPEALKALELHGFVIDPGGIRAMGLPLG